MKKKQKKKAQKSRKRRASVSPPPPKGWVALEEWEPQPEPESDPRQHLRELVRQQVAGGYRTPRQLLKYALEMFSDSVPRAEARALARQAIEEELTKLLKRQQRWPKLTDYDRLEEAFAELQNNQILARQNFWCCGTCGNAAIDDEIKKLKRRKQPVRGYAFFHEQDTESAVDHGVLMLNYWAAENDDAKAKQIAREIVRTLKKHELRATWNGDLNHRIRVSIDWKRRWPHADRIGN